MSSRPEASTMSVADDATFDEVVLRADRPVLVEFGGRWCGPCKALAPILASVAEETRRPIGMDAYLTVDRNAVYVDPEDQD